MASCDDLPPTAVDVTFLSDYRDRSGNNRQVVHTGGTDSEIGPNGAHFDGNGDCAFPTLRSVREP